MEEYLPKTSWRQKAKRIGGTIFSSARHSFVMSPPVRSGEAFSPLQAAAGHFREQLPRITELVELDTSLKDIAAEIPDDNPNQE
ncbi:MAG TPA: hypothetical protein VFH39_05235 [Candidatus Saccharimonadales bacterium]|nr:hypothetical protein [Candidatus Saccharimonadales bacterium]